MPEKAFVGNRKQLFALAIGLSVLILALIWWSYGGLFVGGGHMDEHGEPQEERVAEFREEVEKFVEANRVNGWVLPPGHEFPVLAEAFYWKPDRIKLEKGVEYEFHLLSTDVTHGFAIQFRTGRVMKELPPGTDVHFELSFEQPGEYLVTCGLFCGIGHDDMIATILVTEGD